MRHGDWSRWKRLRRASDEVSLFSEPRFAESVSAAFDRPCRAFVAFGSEEEVPEAGLIVFERRRGPFRIADPPPFHPHGDLVLRRPFSEADVHHERTPLPPLLDLLAAEYDSVRFDLLPRFRDVRVFQLADWRCRPLYTYRTRIGDLGRTVPTEENRRAEPDAPGWSTWSGSTRRNYRNGRAKFEVRLEPEATAPIVRLCASSYERHGRTLPGTDAPSLQSLAAELVDQGRAAPITARSRENGSVEAGAILLLDRETAYYWIAGSKPGPAMTVLLGALLIGELDRSPAEAWARRCEKLEILDLVGANTPSIAEFKRKFGPELSPYYRVARTSSPVLRIVRTLRPWSGHQP